MARASRAEWAKRVERWQDSGLTAKQFAAETGLSAATLSYWKWRLGRAEKGREARRGAHGRPRADAPGIRAPKAPAARGPKFVEVAAEPRSETGLEIVLAEGVVVRVPVGFDAETLTRVVRAVGATR